MPATAESRTISISDFYRPFPRQTAFHVSPAKYRLFGGAAGPGKSKALLMEAICQGNEVPKSDTLLLRRTFSELEQSLLLYFRRDVPREFYKSFNDSKHVVTWHNDSTLRFGYCESEKDVYQYQGAEYLFIGLDELTLFTLKMWQFLTSRNRCPVPGSYPSMAGATNPGNIGHAWVKALWIDKKAPAGMENPDQYDKNDYDFIQARLIDNPVYANDAAYKKTLAALPTHLRQAFLEGDWNVFAGQYFDNFNVSTHVIDGIELKPWVNRWISIDWGYAHPACAHWHAKDGDEVVTYRELHGSGIGEEELARRIVEMSEGEKIGSVFLSPDAFAKRDDRNTIAEVMGNTFKRFKLPYPTQADNDRIGGARLMHQLLESNLWRMTRDCPKLIECLPLMIHDEKRMEDVLKVDAAEGQLGDDAYDCARYGLKTMLGEAMIPYEIRVRARVEPIADMTQRMIHLDKVMAEEKKKGNHPIRLRRPSRWATVS